MKNNNQKKQTKALPSWKVLATFVYIQKIYTECLHHAKHHTRNLKCICGRMDRSPQDKPLKLGMSLGVHKNSSKWDLQVHCASMLVSIPPTNHSLKSGKMAVWMVFPIYTQSPPDYIFHGNQKLTKEKSRIEAKGILLLCTQIMSRFRQLSRVLMLSLFKGYENNSIY